ncbi:MAG: prepilin-type N-terminal cleavage/methylation domain-containing protein [Exilibacterium sp.]
MRTKRRQGGVTLIELVVFIVVVSVALVALLSVVNYSLSNSIDPLVRVRLLELAQSQLDEVLARKYDENTPTGGVPACGTANGPACAGIGLDGEDISDAGSLDDVDDFNGYSDTPYAGYSRSVEVVAAGGDWGVAAAQAKRITVTVVSPGGESLQLSVYRANF